MLERSRQRSVTLGVVVGAEPKVMRESLVRETAVIKPLVSGPVQDLCKWEIDGNTTDFGSLNTPEEQSEEISRMPLPLRPSVR